ncbi:hypothetical protein PMIN04_011146 [Paraphaeosphaeria minitans]
MPAPENTRGDNHAGSSQPQTALESPQAERSEEPFSAVLARSLQSYAPPSPYTQPIEAVIARYTSPPSAPPNTPSRVYSPPLATKPAPSHVWADTSKIPASGYLRLSSCGQRSIRHELPACLQAVKRVCHTKAVFYDVVAKFHYACLAEHTADATATPETSIPETSTPVRLLDQTSAHPSIVLTGAEHAQPTMCLHTWEDAGGDVYRWHKVVVAIPAPPQRKRRVWRGCWGVECSMNGKGSSLRCAECYTRAWLNFATTS